MADVEDYERLPFPPGESPFHVKGNAYRGHVEYTDKHVPGGMKAAIERIQDEKLRAFFAQPFLASSWYDIFPLVAIGFVCARLAGRSFPDFLRARARQQAELDVGGVYRFLLSLASPETVVTKLPAVVAQYFDFGTVEVRRLGPRLYTAISHGWPRPLAAWYAPIQETYALYALESNGAKNPRAKLYPFAPEATERGLEVGAFRVELSWDD